MDSVPSCRAAKSTERFTVLDQLRVGHLLKLGANMFHRFHAESDAHVDSEWGRSNCGNIRIRCGVDARRGAF
jgi:hypothetical protein